MKTRTLLLLSLACALAIAGAGIGLLWQVRGDQEVSPVAAIGDAVVVGDLSVTVLTALRGAGEIRVGLELGGVDDALATDGMSLLAAGEAQPVLDGDCDPVTVSGRRCEVVFADLGADSHVLAVKRGEQVRRWVLPVD